MSQKFILLTKLTQQSFIGCYNINIAEISSYFMSPDILGDRKDKEANASRWYNLIPEKFEFIKNMTIIRQAVKFNLQGYTRVFYIVKIDDDSDIVQFRLMFPECEITE